MRTARRFRLLTVIALLALAVGSSALPASAATLAITSLDCQPRHGGFLCTGYVSGGTAPYTYTWNHGAITGSNNAASSTIVIGCPAGSTTVRTITFTVTDSRGASASQSTQIDCSETW